MNEYSWANNNRLLFSVRSSTRFAHTQLNYTRLGSIGRDGKNAVMFDMEPNRYGRYLQNALFINTLEDDPNHVLAALDLGPDAWFTPDVDLVDIRTGKKKRHVKNYRGAMWWLADAGGNVRIAGKLDTKFDDRNLTIFYRETEANKWEVLQKIDFFNNNRMVPYRFDDEDANILLVSSNNLQDLTVEEEFELKLFRFDLTTRKVLGRHIDENYEKVVAIVERALPELKVKMVSRDKARSRFIFRAYSDIQPPEFYLLDIDNVTLKIIGEQYPALRDKSLATMSELSYRARDGMEIPAFLTLPNIERKTNLPLIVYPHGGPWAHDKWGFENYVQFFASRGYAVFQPQFRGSTGRGSEHTRAGYGQWGHKIQDDITEGVKHLIAQGVVDPDRVCIVGASFGGYAAAMGIVKTPDLYRCGVSINGVLDLQRFHNDSNKILLKTINRAMWNETDKLLSASPYHLVDNIKAPLLLIASELDTVVPVAHSTEMYKKMKKQNKNISYIELPKGEHYRTNEANEITSLRAIETFLAEHLQSRAGNNNIH